MLRDLGNSGENNLNLEQLKLHASRLEQQLLRERTARKKAEDMLRVKTRELLASNEFVSSMTERLQLAIASADEVVWEYAIAENNFYQYDGFQDGRGKIDLAASYDDVYNIYHFDDQDLASGHWQKLMADESDSMEFAARRYSLEHKEFRWNLVRGKKLFDKKSGKAISVLGMFRDIHEEQLTDLAYLAIKNTFNSSEVPGFLCDFNNQFVILSDSFYKLLALKENEVSQEQLWSLLPIDQIRQNQTDDNKPFESELMIAGTAKKYLFRFSPLTQTPKSDGYVQYAVGFVVPI